MRAYLQHEAGKALGHVGTLYRPPSEAESFVLQATIGCSWNHCSYCVMYHGKNYSVRPLPDILADVRKAGERYSQVFDKVFVADGDALSMGTKEWLVVLQELRRSFPLVRQVGCYATARNVLAKSSTELKELNDAGLSIVYMGPESGDNDVLKLIVKGSTAAEHVEAAQRIKAAGIKNSAIFLLGVGGVELSQRHAEQSAWLATQMDPEYLAALTVEVIPGTVMEKKVHRGRIVIPDAMGTLQELRIFIEKAAPTNAVFRSNHASNYLPLAGNLPKDRDRLLAILDQALEGSIPLREEHERGL